MEAATSISGTTATIKVSTIPGTAATGTGTATPGTTAMGTGTAIQGTMAMGTGTAIPGTMAKEMEMFAKRMALTLCVRSEEHTPELQSLMRTPYAVCCLEKQS